MRTKEKLKEAKDEIKCLNETIAKLKAPRKVLRKDLIQEMKLNKIVSSNEKP
jgi:hypothetical protein